MICPEAELHSLGTEMKSRALKRNGAVRPRSEKTSEGTDQNRTALTWKCTEGQSSATEMLGVDRRRHA